MQDFDHRDCDSERFFGCGAYATEADAHQALALLRLDAAKLLGILPEFLA